MEIGSCLAPHGYERGGLDVLLGTDEQSAARPRALGRVDPTHDSCKEGLRDVACGVQGWSEPGTVAPPDFV